MTETPDPIESPEETLERLRASVRERTQGERYDVQTEIARGGMGVVLQVLDRRMRRTLAMKVLREPGGEASADSTFQSKFTARFLEEAQVTGQLDHPGIVPVHEMGLDQEDRLFFTMRLVKGRTLDEVFTLARAEDESWSQARALGVIHKVCEAMAYAHDHGVIHRDLKPANIMVGRFGETYVMDWGLAKLVGRDEPAPERSEPKQREPAALRTVLTSTRKDESSVRSGSALTTLDGDVIGTPAYMAPEQALGRVAEVGPLSDVYAVGALLYHLLAGHAPYMEAGEDVPLMTVLERVMEGPPAPLGRDVPAELVAITERAMAREPEQRYASMLALGDDLRAFLEGRVVAAYDTGAVAEFKKWVGRNRGLAASLALALVLGFGGLAAVSIVQTRAREELATTNTELATTNADLALARSAAEESAARALQNESEAVWQSYAANVAAAGASLDLGAARRAAEQLAACAPEHRGWEWRFLQNQVDASLRSVVASEESYVYAVAFDPLGRVVASGSGNFGDAGGNDFRVRLWDAETGAPLRDLVGHNAAVQSLAFSPAGTELASIATDGTTRIWDVASGEEIGRTTGVGGWALAFHPQELRVAMGSGNRLFLWDALEDRVTSLATLERFTSSLAISPDGKLLVAGLKPPGLVFYDLPNRRSLGTLDLDVLGAGDATLGVEDLAIGPGGEVAVALPSGDVLLVDTETREIVRKLSGHRDAVLSVAFTPDGQGIVTSSSDATLRRWDAATGTALEVLQGHDRPVHSVAVGPDGHRVVSGSDDGTLRWWDARPGSSVTTLQGSGPNTFLAYEAFFDPSGTKLAWRSDERTWRITDALTGEDVCQLPSLSVEPRGATFTPDGAYLVTCGNGDHVRVWDASTGLLVEVRGEPLPTIGPAVFDPSASLVAAATQEGLQLFRADTGETVWTRELLPSFFPGFSADGSRVGIGTVDGGLRVFDVASGETVFRAELDAQVLDLAFDPSGEWIAATTYDNWDDSLWILDADTGAVLRTLRGHAQPTMVDILPGGEGPGRIVTGNWDGTFSLWDVERGELAVLTGHSGIVFELAVDPTGERIVTAESGGLHRVWETTSVAERQGSRLAAARRAVLARQAAPLVEAWLAELILKPDVARRIADAPRLTPDERASALRLLWCAPFPITPPPDDPLNAPVSYAFGLCVNPDGTPDQYLRALRTMEEVVRLDIHAPRSPLWWILAFAQYRMGRVDEALATARESRSASMQENNPGTAMTDILIALCLLDLGEPAGRAEAETLIGRWRRALPMFRGGTETTDQLTVLTLQELLDEAEAKLGE